MSPTSLPAHRRVAAVLVLIPVMVALALWAFAWPAARTAPRDLPLGVAGPPAATAPVAQELERREGAFDLHRYADEAEARDAIEGREVYGAVVVTPKGPKLLTASAASPAVAQLLQQAVTQQAQAAGQEITAEDVVPAPASDPRGAVLNTTVLPLALAGIGAGVAVTLLGLRGLTAVAALAGSATLVGVVAAALAHTWLDALPGDRWAVTGTFALATLAVSAAVAGLAALPGSRLVLRQPALPEPVEGSASDLAIQADELARIRARTEEMLARHTGRTADRVRADLERDLVLDARAAVEYGLADRIVPHHRDARTATGAR
ncbi:ATP-dependent Clp protease proteolytic subunit [Streptomyces griseoloalbus]